MASVPGLATLAPIHRSSFFKFPWNALRLPQVCALQGFQVMGFVGNRAISFKPVPRKKALLIGINYGRAVAQPGGELKGPQNDVEEMYDLLISTYGYRSENIVVLSDKAGVEDDFIPTRANIMRELRAFLDDQKPGDHYAFLFAGHASQIESNNVRERDRKDEQIETSDGGTIIDDILYKYLVEPLLPDSHLTAIFDSCHSGTLLDLPHDKCNRVFRITSSGRRSLRRVLEPVWPDLIVNSTNNVARGLRGVLAAQLFPGSFCSGYCPRLAQSGPSPNIFCISACKDHQLSYETEEGKSLTRIIVETLKETPHPTLKRLMRATSDRSQALNKEIIQKQAQYDRERKEFRQMHGLPVSGPRPAPPELEYRRDPQLSSLRPLRMNSRFDL